MESFISHRNGIPDIELKPESATKFFYGDGTDRQIEFETDSNGKVTKVWFLNMGQKGRIEKNRIEFTSVRINDYNRHKNGSLSSEKNNYLFLLSEKRRHPFLLSIRLRKLSTG